MPTTPYNINEISFTIDGVEIRGGGDSDFVSVETAEDLFTPKAGVDGEVWWSANNNKIATLTVSLMYGSAANQILDGYKKKDLRDGSGYFKAQIRDPQTGNTITLEEARITKEPTVTLGKEIQPMEWTIMGRHSSELGRGY